MAERQLIETNSSRGQVKADGFGDRSSAEFHFVATGCSDEADVLDLVNSERGDIVPDPFDTGTEQLSLRNIDITERINPDSWRVVVHYLGVPQTLIQYDFGASTQHITCSLETITRLLPDDTTLSLPPDFKGTIGSDGQGNVAGVDRITPNFTWTETHYFTADEWTTDLITTLRDAIGFTNEAEWTAADEIDYDPTTVLFMGATAVQRESNLWEVAYKFAYSKTLTDVTISQRFSNVTKKGWHYLWFLFRQSADTDSGVIVDTPTALYIERTYDEMLFTSLFPS